MGKQNTGLASSVRLHDGTEKDYVTHPVPDGDWLIHDLSWRLQYSTKHPALFRAWEKYAKAHDFNVLSEEQIKLREAYKLLHPPKPSPPKKSIPHMFDGDG